MPGMDIGGGDIVAYMKTLQKETVNTDNSVKKLDSDLEKLMQKANAAVSKSQAAATRVAGVYGRAGTQGYSGYKPKGIKTPNLGDFSVLPNRKQGNWNEQNSKIDWVSQGSSKFIPAKSPVQQQTNTFFGRLVKSLKSNDGQWNKLNKSMFKFQMATLGLGFSFSSLENSLTGILGSVGNLSQMFTSKALGKAFGGVDVASTMGVSSQDMVKGWENFTGILSMIQTLFASISSKVLSPEVMAAIGELFTKLAQALSDGAVAKALSDIIIDMAKFLETLIPFLPIFAQILDTLAPIIAPLLVFATILGTLLPILSALGYVGTVIELLADLIPLFSVLGALLSAISAPMLIIAAIAATIIDFLVHFVQNLQSGQSVMQAFTNALGQTVNDIVSALNAILSPILAVANIGTGGMVNGLTSAAGQTVASTTNYIFNGSYSDPNALVKQAQTAKAKTG